MNISFSKKSLIQRTLFVNDELQLTLIYNREEGENYDRRKENGYFRWQ